MTRPRTIEAARGLTAEAERALHRSPAFLALDPERQGAILGDLASIAGALSGGPNPPPARDPYSFALETPADLRRRLAESRLGRVGPGTPGPAEEAGSETDASDQRPPRRQATETLAERTGALIDEVDFVGFVAGLIHGTFDAIVDASIRQMEAFADLVSSVAKSVDQFTRDNVTTNQARDFLAQKHPEHLRLELGTDVDSTPRLLPRGAGEDAFGGPSPAWLSEYGLEGEELTPGLIEESLLPAAQRQIGEARLQTLATMVLLGMNRVVVRDGSITARVRFRAAASDQAKVDFAAGADPASQDSWGTRGSAMYQTHRTMVSTVGVNAQTETTIKAELFGEVRLNFASETLPLERFADPARLALLTRNARYFSQGRNGGSGASSGDGAQSASSTGPPASQAPGSTGATPPPTTPPPPAAPPQATLPPSQGGPASGTAPVSPPPPTQGVGSPGGTDA